MDTSKDNIRDRSTNTREQVARLSGVGTGTVARYDAVMKPCTKNSRKKTQKSYLRIS